MLYQGSDGQVHVLGDGEELKHWKYIKKIKTGNGWRYFYSQDEINAYMKEIKKNTIDKAPLPEKIGEKYYIGNKKTRNAIRRSGAGGNMVGNTGKLKNNLTEKQARNLSGKDLEKFNKYYDKNWTKIEDSSRESLRNEYRKHKEAYKYAKDAAAKKGVFGNLDESAVDYYKLMKIREKTAAKGYKEASNAITKKYEKYEIKNVAKNKVNSGRSAIEKKLNKTKKTATNEVKGVKRVTKAINTAGKAKTKGTKYSKNGKTYRNWKETPSGTIGYNYYVEEGKKKKTGKAERMILSAYRKTPKGKRWSLTR